MKTSKTSPAKRGAPQPTLSELIQAWRASVHLSQTAAAALVPVSQNTWSDWEAGKKIPRTPNALRLRDMSSGAIPIEACCGVVAGKAA